MIRTVLVAAGSNGDHRRDMNWTAEDWLWAVALILFIATWVIAAVHP
jgi:hypothetical protein